MAKNNNSGNGCGCAVQLLIFGLILIGLCYGVPFYRHMVYVKKAHMHISEGPLSTDLLLAIQSDGKSIDEVLGTPAAKELCPEERITFYRRDWDLNDSRKKAFDYQKGLEWLATENGIDLTDKLGKRFKESIDELNKIITFSRGLSYDQSSESLKCDFAMSDMDNKMKTYSKFDNNFDWDRLGELEWNKFKSFVPHISVINFDALLGMGQYTGVVLDSLKTYSIKTHSTPLISSMFKVAILAAKTSPGVYGNLVKNQIVSNIKPIYNYVKDNKLEKQEYSELLKALESYKSRSLDFDNIIKEESNNTTYLLDYYHANAFVYMYTMRIKNKDVYKEAEEIYEAAKSASNDELLKLKSSANASSNIILKELIPDFYSVKKACIETNSRLAILQAWLEERLGKPVTAVDPADGKPIRSANDSDGNKFYYCIGIDGKDEKGAGDDIDRF